MVSVKTDGETSLHTRCHLLYVITLSVYFDGQGITYLILRGHFQLVICQQEGLLSKKCV